jgi:hypothetical membrane protein
MYYAFEHGSRPLPSMSETWDRPPGTYLSRFFLPFVSFGYMGTGFCIYKSRIKNGFEQSELTLNILGGIGLCGVASVTDKEIPYLHFLFAMMAFFCTDAYLMVLYSQSQNRSLLQGASMAVSVLTKIRFIPISWLREAALCIFEWVDAVSIYAFLTSYVFTHCPDVTISIN